MMGTCGTAISAAAAAADKIACVEARRLLSLSLLLLFWFKCSYEVFIECIDLIVSMMHTIFDIATGALMSSSGVSLLVVLICQY